ncbi:MAG: NlpC/P60 family protein [Actinobacteria bacterium]|nr:NlpC/P60 family protein [Actinomycetota bacterium]
MRPVSRKHARPTVVVLTVVAALAAGLALVGVPTAASAQTPIPMAAPAAHPAPQVVTAASMLMVAMGQDLARLEIVTSRATILTAQERAALNHRVAAVKVKQLRVRLVSVAKKQIGDRYSAGASGPSAFDCSGLTRYVYKVVTGRELPHQSHAQFSRVKRITRANAQPGDLVFFFRGGAHHVGIYIGHGHMVDAAGYGEGVRISPISGSWWSRSYSGMGRLLPA